MAYNSRLSFVVEKRLRRIRAKGPNGGAYPRVLNMKHAQEYCYSSLEGMLVHRGATPQEYLAGTYGTEERQSGVKFLVY